MTKRRLLFASGLLVLAIFVAFPTVSNAQSKLEERWINIPSSPLDLRFSPSKRDSSLDNRSGGVVVQFDLGCVVSDSDSRIRVLKKLRTTPTRLEPRIALLNSVSVHEPDMKRCEKMKRRLAVIEVVFVDGFAWRAKYVDGSIPGGSPTD